MDWPAQADQWGERPPDARRSPRVDGWASKPAHADERIRSTRRRWFETGRISGSDDRSTPRQRTRPARFVPEPSGRSKATEKKKKMPKKMTSSAGVRCDLGSSVTPRVGAGVPELATPGRDDDCRPPGRSVRVSNPGRVRAVHPRPLRVRQHPPRRVHLRRPVRHPDQRGRPRRRAVVSRSTHGEEVAAGPVAAPSSPRASPYQRVRRRSTVHPVYTTPTPLPSRTSSFVIARPVTLCRGGDGGSAGERVDRCRRGRDDA